MNVDYLMKAVFNMGVMKSDSYMSLNEPRDRCVAYITRGDNLLVFTHINYPEAGVLVPAGHPEDGESLESAVIREAED